MRLPNKQPLPQEAGRSGLLQGVRLCRRQAATRRRRRVCEGDVVPRFGAGSLQVSISRMSATGGLPAPIFNSVTDIPSDVSQAGLTPDCLCLLVITRTFSTFLLVTVRLSSTIRPDPACIFNRLFELCREIADSTTASSSTGCPRHMCERAFMNMVAQSLLWYNRKPFLSTGSTLTGALATFLSETLLFSSGSSQNKSLSPRTARLRPRRLWPRPFSPLVVLSGWASLEEVQRWLFPLFQKWCLFRKFI